LRIAVNYLLFNYKVLYLHVIAFFAVDSKLLLSVSGIMTERTIPAVLYALLLQYI